MADSVYREAPRDVRFICTVAYDSVASAPASCPRCNAPLLPLDNREVRGMLLAYVEAQLARKRTRLSGIGVVGALLLAAIVCFALRLPFVDPNPSFGQTGSWFISIALVLSGVWWYATAKIFAAPSGNEPVAALLQLAKVEKIDEANA